MKDVFVNNVYKKRSIVNLIQGSPDFQQVFKAKKKHLLKSAVFLRDTIRNMQMRKHRFNSMTRPAGRWCLFLRAVVITAVWITRMRRGKPECNDANEFLADITEEDCTLLAMMMDGADEVNMVTVFTDGIFDATEFARKIHMLIRRCDALFLQGHARNSGYTKSMIETLNMSPLVFNVGTAGQVKSLGGPGKLTEARLNNI